MSRVLRIRISAKEIEEVNITEDENSTGSAIFKNVRVVKIPIQSAQRVCPADDGGVNHGIVIRVRRDHSRSWSRKYDLGNLFGPEIAQKLPGFIFAQLRDPTDPVIREYPFKLLQQKW